MSTELKSQDSAVFVIAGAGNPRIWGSLSPSSFVYRDIRNATRSCEYLIPELCGVAPIDFTYRSLKRVLDHKVEKYSPQQKITLVGHSLGATIAARYMAENPEVVVKTIAIAGVFGPIRSGVGRDSVVRHVDKTRELLGSQPENQLHCFGTSHDEIVPLESALPDMAGNNRYLVDTPVGSPTGRLCQWLVPGFIKEHALIVTHTEVLERTTTLTSAS